MFRVDEHKHGACTPSQRSTQTGVPYMQPDRPHLCCFWIEGVLAMMQSSGVDELSAPVSMLQAFLWRYTRAAVPAHMRAELLRSLSDLLVRAVAIPRPSSRAPSEWTIASCECVSWVLQKDSAFQSWAAGQEPSVSLPTCTAPGRGLAYIDLANVQLTRRCGASSAHDWGSGRVTTVRPNTGFWSDTPSAQQALVSPTLTDP